MIPAHMILLVISILIVSSVSSLQERGSSTMLGKAKLLEELRTLSAFKEKLSPSGDDNIINIRFNYRPNGILMVDEVEQSVTSVGHVNVFWKDPDLTWNETDYMGVKYLVVPYEEVWHPTIVVNNAAHPDFFLVDRVKTVRISSSGDVAYVTPVFLKTICDIDLKFYPFDSQNCDVLFLPFLEDSAYNITEATISGTQATLKVTGQWSIVSTSITVDVVEESLDVHAIRFSMNIKRNPVYYVVCILIPIVVSSSITSLVFWIPPSSGEKISFLVTVFVSNAVFLNFIAGTMPRNMTNLPRLTLYLIMVILQCVFAMVGTIFVIRKFEQEQKQASVQHQEMDDTIFVSGLEDSPAHKTRNQIGSKGRIADLHTLKLSETQVQALETKTRNVKSTRKKPCCGCPKATTWDIMFFVVFHVISVPCYYLLFLP